MKSYRIIFLCILGAMLTLACSQEFLEEVPFGEVSPAEMTRPENVERAIIAAYSVLNGQFDNATSGFNSPASNWSFGDAVSDDCYKGGGGTGDQNQIHQMEIFNTTPVIADVQRKWLALFEGIKRTNYALYLLGNSEGFNAQLKDVRTGELLFLRGHYYFELKKIYKNVPFLDEEDIEIDSFYKGNKDLTDTELWSKIETDFRNAKNLLPDSQQDIGRPNRYTASAYLAKTYVFQKKWNETIQEADEVINSGKYRLLDDFRDVFLPENDNSEEIIFAVQFSVNDGEPRHFNGAIGDRLSAPGGPHYPQYGFHRPSQNLINAYKVDQSGIPVAGNNLSEQDFVDPRLDHTVGRPGIPYLDLGINYEASWARDLSTYGPFAPKKRIVSALSSLQVKVWPYISSLNYYVIRYPDLLLWKAEALVETGNLEGARELVNQVRIRAKNTKPVLALNSQMPAAKYAIDSYQSPWNNADVARNAVRLERRLELAMEGHRFFDLVRWEIADEVMNTYFDSEKNLRSHLTNGRFVKGKHEYFPIPQLYIDIVGNENVIQNSGY
jgi:hypothetical protein